MLISTPSVSESCSEDVSLYVKSYNCNDSVCSSGKCLNLTIKNNGNFNINGFFIRTSNDTSTIPTTGLKCDFSEACESSFNEDGMIYFTMVYGYWKPLAPGEELELIFNYENISSLEKIQLEPFLVSKSSMQMCSDATVNIEVDDSKRCN